MTQMYLSHCDTNRTSPYGNRVRRYICHGYYQLCWRNPITKTRTSVLEHRFVWQECYGPIPPGQIIHHVDHNPLNNEISNLQCVSKSQHMKIHHTKYTPEQLKERQRQRDREYRKAHIEHKLEYDRNRNRNPERLRYMRDLYYRRKAEKANYPQASIKQ